MYRSKLRSFPKMLNSLHLNILSNFSEISNSTNQQISQNPEDPIINLIAKDFCSFYKFNAQNIKNKNRYEDFRTKKQTEIEIHEIITRIGVNITTFPKVSLLLLEQSYFYDDIMDYLLFIAFAEHNFNTEKNFISYLVDVKNKNKDLVKRVTTSIVENSILIMIRSMTEQNDVMEKLINKVSFNFFTISLVILILEKLLNYLI